MLFRGYGAEQQSTDERYLMQPGCDFGKTYLPVGGWAAILKNK